MILSKLWERFRRNQKTKWVPVVDSKGFINTEEGWRLYGECMQTGDIMPYRQVKKAYFRHKRREERRRRTR